jgi:hypothetical protein
MADWPVCHGELILVGLPAATGIPRPADAGREV